MTPDLIGCPLVKRQSNGELLRAVMEEMEAYYQSELACHGCGCKL
jgi:DNA-3-methyladenine glycosylase